MKTTCSSAGMLCEVSARSWYKALIAIVCMALVFVSKADGLSDPVRVLLDPGSFALWHTVSNCVFDLEVEYPEFADSAELDVVGVKFRRTYSNITERVVRVTVPEPVDARTENVYALTMEYNDGTVCRAVVGVVRGHGLGCETLAGVRVTMTGGDSEPAEFATPRVVIPIPNGAASLYVNNALADTGLDGDRGWFALGPARNGDSFELRYADAFASLRAVGPGFMLLLR